MKRETFFRVRSHNTLRLVILLASLALITSASETYIKATLPAEKDCTEKTVLLIQSGCAGEQKPYSETCKDAYDPVTKEKTSYCSSPDIPKKNTGPHCGTITLCGQPKKFQYGEKNGGVTIKAHAEPLGAQEAEKPKADKTGEETLKTKAAEEKSEVSDEQKLKTLSTGSCSGNDGKCGQTACGDKECIQGEKCKYGKWFTVPVFGDVGAGCNCEKNDECPHPGGPCLGTPIGECNQNRQRCSQTLDGEGMLGPVDEDCSPCSPDDLKITFEPSIGGDFIDYPGSVSYLVEVENLGDKDCVTPAVYLEFGFGQADVKYRFKDYTLSNKHLTGKEYYKERWVRVEVRVDASEKNEISVSWANEEGSSESIKTYKSEEVKSFIANNDKFKYRAYLEGSSQEELRDAPLRRRSTPRADSDYALDGTVASKADTIYLTATAKYSDGLRVIVETGDGLQYMSHTNLKMISEAPGRSEYLIEGDQAEYKIEYMCVKEGETDFSIAFEKGTKPFPVETEIMSEPFTKKIVCKKALEIRPGCKVKLDTPLSFAVTGNKIPISVYVGKINECICPGCKVKFYVDLPGGQSEYTVESKEKDGVGDYIYEMDKTGLPTGEYTFYAIAYAPDGTQMSDKSAPGSFKVTEPVKVTESQTNCGETPVGQCDNEGRTCQPNDHGEAVLTPSFECGWGDSCREGTKLGECSEDEEGMMCRGQSGNYDLVANERCKTLEIKSADKPAGANEKKLKILFVPLYTSNQANTWSSQQEFNSKVNELMGPFITATPLAACKDKVRLDKAAIGSPECLVAYEDFFPWNVLWFKMTYCAYAQGYKQEDYDFIAGIMKTPPPNVVGRSEAKYIFAPASQNTILAHELGHLFGLVDEYCSNPAGSADPGCNDGTTEPNNLDKELGCDPSGPPCCNQIKQVCDESSPKWLAQYQKCICFGTLPNGGSSGGNSYKIAVMTDKNGKPIVLAEKGQEFYIDCAKEDGCETGKIHVNSGACCYGNIADPSTGGRCIMSYADAPGPRYFCDNCKKHLAESVRLQC